MVTESPYGRPRLIYQHADGSGVTARDSECPSAPLRGLSIAGMQNTGTNFLMGTFMVCERPNCTRGDLLTPPPPSQANCNWSAPTGARTPRTRAFTDGGRSPFVQHRHPRHVPVEWSISYTPKAARDAPLGKHTYIRSPLLQAKGYTSTADCDGCAVLVPVRHPLVWMRSMCQMPWKMLIREGNRTCGRRGATRLPVDAPIECTTSCPGIRGMESLPHYWARAIRTARMRRASDVNRVSDPRFYSGTLARRAPRGVRRASTCLRPLRRPRDQSRGDGAKAVRMPRHGRRPVRY